MDEDTRPTMGEVRHTAPDDVSADAVWHRGSESDD